jgi:hypothetical protein
MRQMGQAFRGEEIDGLAGRSEIQWLPPFKPANSAGDTEPNLTASDQINDAGETEIVLRVRIGGGSSAERQAYGERLAEHLRRRIATDPNTEVGFAFAPRDLLGVDITTRTDIVAEQPF